MGPNELRNLAKQKLDEARALSAAAEKENRNLNDEENTKYTDLMKEVDSLTARAQRLEDEEKRGMQFAPPADVNNKNQRNEQKDLGEFLQTVRFNPGDSGLVQREQRDMNMGQGEAGGFMVPTQIETKLRSIELPDAIFRPRATVVPAGDAPDASYEFPALDQSGARGVYSGIQVQWIGEGADKPETEARLRHVKLEPKEVAGHIVITDKLLRNAPAVGALCEKLFRGAINSSEEERFISGNGVASPLGIIGHPAAVQVQRANANQIGYIDLVNMFSRTMGSRFAWLASKTALPQLMTMTDNAGHLIWQPNAREGTPGTLLGYPVMLSDQVPTLGNEGDLTLVDLTYYLIKDGFGIAIAMSPHVYFNQNKTVIKAFWNVDGQPWLNTPLLLRDGVTTVSPFVVLQ